MKYSLQMLLSREIRFTKDEGAYNIYKFEQNKENQEDTQLDLKEKYKRKI